MVIDYSSPVDFSVWRELALEGIFGYLEVEIADI